MLLYPHNMHIMPLRNPQYLGDLRMVYAKFAFRPAGNHMLVHPCPDPLVYPDRNTAAGIEPSVALELPQRINGDHKMMLDSKAQLIISHIAAGIQNIRKACTHSQFCLCPAHHLDPSTEPA